MSGAHERTSWPDAEVVVQIEWKGWRTAMVRLAALQNIHWLQPAGGCRPLVHGFVRCTEILSGNIEHLCEPTTRPHILLVCVLKSHTVPSIFALLARAADERSTMLQAERACSAAVTARSALPSG